MEREREREREREGGGGEGARKELTEKGKTDRARDRKVYKEEEVE